MEKITNINGVDNTRIEELLCLFPEIESDGKINFDKLKALLGNDIDESDEKYEFTWPGKKEMLKNIDNKSRATLRPKEISGSQNLYIEGDNLEVLKILKENYQGKIKCIYIDPPYNTENDFIYMDDFTQGIEQYKKIANLENIKNSELSGRLHSGWLNMMYPRLHLAGELLSEDGAIFISIDENERSNLKKICDEIFGEKNYVGTFTWLKNMNPPSLSKSNIRTKTEPILVYGKKLYVPRGEKIRNEDSSLLNEGNARKRLVISEKVMKFNFIENGIIPKGKYKRIELISDIIIENGRNANKFETLGQFRWSQKKLDEEILKGGHLIAKTNELNFRYQKGSSDVENYNMPVDIIQIDMEEEFLDKLGTTKDGSALLFSLFGVKNLFPNPKPINLMKKIIEISNLEENPIVLDFFSGSGTIAHAIMELNAQDGGNRKYICVQLPELCDKNDPAKKAGYDNICDIGQERIRRAAKKIKEENSDKEYINDIDLGFNILTLDDSNIKPFESFESSLDVEMIDQIKSDRSDLDVLYEMMFRHGIKFDIEYEHGSIGGCEFYNVGYGELVYVYKNITTENIDAIINSFKEMGITLDNAKFIFRESQIIGENRDSTKISIQKALQDSYNINYIRGI